MENLSKLAEVFVKREYALLNQDTPSLKDVKYGKKRKNLKQYEADLRAYTNEIKSNEQLYKTACEKFGEDIFFEAVENERYEIGKKVFGFNQ